MIARTTNKLRNTNKLKHRTFRQLKLKKMKKTRGHISASSSGGARDFLLQVLWRCAAFYRGSYESGVISYLSHVSLLQHLPTISSYLFTCLLSEASLWSMKSAIQIDRIIIMIRLLPTDAHIAVFLCDGH